MGKAFGNNSFYEFANYRLDPVERTLWQDGKFVALPSKVFDTLCVLVENQGRIVSKTEILDTVWKDLFVEEGNLTQNIYTLRRVLGTDASGEQFIETVPKKGYRFVPPVTVIGGVEERETVAVPVSAESVHELSEVRPAKRNWRPIAALAVVLMVVTTAIAGGLYYFRSTGSTSETVSAKQASFQKLNFSGDITFPVIAPSGDAFAYVSEGKLYLQQGVSETPVTVEITGLKDIGSPQFSRDGMHLSYRDKAELFMSANVQRVSIIGGVPEKIAENVWGGFSYSPSGQQIAFIRHFPNTNKQHLIIKDLPSGNERVLHELESPFRFAYGGYPSWSYDATKIALPVSEQSIQIPSTQLAIFDVNSGSMSEMKMPQFRHIMQAVWLPDGNSLLMVAREARRTLQIWEADYPSGSMRKITNDGNIYRTLTVSGDGKKVLTGQFTTVSHIWTAEGTDASSAKQITKGNLNRDGVIGFTMNANDELIYTSRNGGVVDLWQLNLVNGAKTQLTKNVGEQNARPSASADGKHIYFTSIRTGKNQIWRMNADSGDAQIQVTTNEEETAQFPQVSPDGKVLYYVKKAAKEKNKIWRRFLDDNREELLPISGDVSPENFLAISPDGEFLATCDLSDTDVDEDEDRVYRIAILSTESAAAPNIISSPSAKIVWGSDSRSVDYVGGQTGEFAIWRQTLDGQSEPREMFRLGDIRLANFAWTKDQKTLVYANRRVSTDAILLTDFK